jgi:hypothetical protein
MHRAGEGGERPGADARLGVGRDVGRIDRPEGRRYRITAGIGRAALGGVAGGAIARPGKRLAPGDLRGAKLPGAGGVIGAIEERQPNPVTPPRCR